MLPPLTPYCKYLHCHQIQQLGLLFALETYDPCIGFLVRDRKSRPSMGALKVTVAYPGQAAVLLRPICTCSLYMDVKSYIYIAIYRHMYIYTHTWWLYIHVYVYMYEYIIYIYMLDGNWRGTFRLPSLCLCHTTLAGDSQSCKAVLSGVRGPTTLIFLGFSGKLQAGLWSFGWMGILTGSELLEEVAVP